MFSELGAVMDIPNNLLDLLKGSPNARWNNSIKVLWVCVVWAILWGIWKERNFRTFNDEFDSIFVLWDKIRYWVAIWVKSSKDFRHIPLRFVYGMEFPIVKKWFRQS